MLRNFLSQSIQVLSASRPLAKSIHTSQLRFQQSNVEDENEPYQTDRSNGIKNLEKLGIAKPHWSWPKYNRTIFPPTEDGVPLMNPFVHHQRNFIKYSAKKLWYPAFLIRGMTIDEAIKQLSFHKLKGAEVIKEVLLEAQELAVKEHNIEFRSNMWVSYSTATNAMKVKGIRKHMGTRMGMVTYKYSHYYVRLEEGKPPVDYKSKEDTYEARAKAHIENLRNRSIYLSI